MRVSVGTAIAIALVILMVLVFRFRVWDWNKYAAAEDMMSGGVVQTNCLTVIPVQRMSHARKTDVAAGELHGESQAEAKRLARKGVDLQEAPLGAVHAPVNSLPTGESCRQVERRVVQWFDDLTDKWSKSANPPVTVDDVKAFVAVFQNLPPSVRQAHLQRSLNLIPDENVLLLAGILLDKGTDEAFAKLIFNDIINRDESVKLPILKKFTKTSHIPVGMMRDGFLR